MKICIGIATKGRPAILAETLRLLENQTRRPDVIIVCPTCEEDVPTRDIPEINLPIRVIHGPTGSCAQRNTVLKNTNDMDLVLFIDDDFFLEPDYLSRCERLFEVRSEVVASTGQVLADGINGPGFTPDLARQLLAETTHEKSTNISASVKTTYAAYGCNMAVRCSTVREECIRFDEKLPLYAWQEDVDFSRQLSKFGEVVFDSRLRGVHLGHKSGRTSGVKFGYSQVANPVFLCRKGTLSLFFACRLMMKNAIMNILRSPFPEPWADRRGRLKGNALAVLHFFQGKLDPEVILKL